MDVVSNFFNPTNFPTTSVVFSTLSLSLHFFEKDGPGKKTSNLIKTILTPFFLFMTLRTQFPNRGNLLLSTVVFMSPALGILEKICDYFQFKKYAKTINIINNTISGIGFSALTLVALIYEKSYMRTAAVLFYSLVLSFLILITFPHDNMPTGYQFVFPLAILLPISLVVRKCFSSLAWLPSTQSLAITTLATSFNGCLYFYALKNET